MEAYGAWRKPCALGEKPKGEGSGMISEKEKRTNETNLKEAVKEGEAKFSFCQDVRDSLKQESLILAQDERWRRA